MDILAIETSTTTGTIALYRDYKPVDVIEFHSDRSHNSLLFAPLRSILAQAEDLQLLVAGTGPGSYTGVRVGISAALGISIAREVPLIGLPSICGLAHAFGTPAYAVCGDARRGMWWWAEVNDGVVKGPPVLMDAESLQRTAAAYPGQVFTPDAAAPSFCHATPTWPRAEILAARSAAMTAECIAAESIKAVEPIYLSAPFVTVSRKPVFA